MNSDQRSTAGGSALRIQLDPGESIITQEDLDGIRNHQREADAALVTALAEQFEAARQADYRFCSYEAIVQLVALAEQIRSGG